ncbi:MAG: AGE family epimerase/isomerase [Actinomycetaceae bacterium]|nr:AGE family epimerase/isomerase [Actinomycetaceae bacterium]
MSWFDAKEHNRWLSHNMHTILEYGHNAAIPTGFGYLRGDGTIDHNQPCWLYITARMTFVYSMGSIMGIPQCRKFATHGLKALETYFYDEEHGGWYEAIEAAPDDNGKAVPVKGHDGKQGFATQCVLLAAATATIANRPGAHELLAKAIDDQEAHWWDPEFSMVHSAWDTAYSQREAYNGLVAQLHAVEAYLSVSDAIHDQLWIDRAVDILHRVYQIAEANHWRIPEHYDAQWEPIYDFNEDDKFNFERPWGITVGHAFEFAHLTLLARAMLEDAGREVPEWMLTMATEIFDRARVDAWNRDGLPGFCYTTDYDGNPVDSRREYWVPLQAVQATVALFRTIQNTGGRSADLEHYEHCYHSWMDYVAEYVFERPGISHYHPASSSGVLPGESHGHQGIYHAFQAMLAPRLPLSPTMALALSNGKLDKPTWRASKKKKKKAWFGRQ